MLNETQKPKVLDNGLSCPLHKRKLSQVCHKCEWYVQLRGTDKNTGDKIDNWGCSMRWLPILSVEIATESRQAAASCDKAASEMEALRISVSSLANAVRRAVGASEVETLEERPMRNITADTDG